MLLEDSLQYVNIFSAVDKSFKEESEKIEHSEVLKSVITNNNEDDEEET